MGTGRIILPEIKLTPVNFLRTSTMPARLNQNKALLSATQTESGLFIIPALPSNYSSSPILLLQFAMASATEGKVDLEAEIMAIKSNTSDVDTASFDSVNVIAGGTTVPGTAGFILLASITLTNNDSMAGNDYIIIRVARDHDDDNDTATGDMELLGGILTYTTI
ncbi:MAG: hypothetical protein A3K77_00550 [Euryarchaeota archaeon RBG_13_31_8]|nr:MAG: hypothetical protein A3K77_00550 [Euryarchaeota archaeon RBG_13_31_8]